MHIWNTRCTLQVRISLLGHQPMITLHCIVFCMKSVSENSSANLCHFSRMNNQPMITLHCIVFCMKSVSENSSANLCHFSRVNNQPMITLHCIVFCMKSVSENSSANLCHFSRMNNQLKAPASIVIALVLNKISAHLGNSQINHTFLT